MQSSNWIISTNFWLKFRTNRLDHHLIASYALRYWLLFPCFLFLFLFLFLLLLLLLWLWLWLLLLLLLFPVSCFLLYPTPPPRFFLAIQSTKTNAIRKTPVPTPRRRATRKESRVQIKSKDTMLPILGSISFMRSMGHEKLVGVFFVIHLSI